MWGCKCWAEHFLLRSPPDMFQDIGYFALNNLSYPPTHILETSRICQYKNIVHFKSFNFWTSCVLVRWKVHSQCMSIGGFNFPYLTWVCHILDRDCWKVLTVLQMWKLNLRWAQRMFFLSRWTRTCTYFILYHEAQTSQRKQNIFERIHEQRFPTFLPHIA